MWDACQRNIMKCKGSYKRNTAEVCDWPTPSLRTLFHPWPHYGVLHFLLYFSLWHLSFSFYSLLCFIFLFKEKEETTTIYSYGYSDSEVCFLYYFILLLKTAYCVFPSVTFAWVHILLKLLILLQCWQEWFPMDYHGKQMFFSCPSQS